MSETLRHADFGRATTYLFVPASQPERWSKAMASGTDAVIVDLEDAVEPGQKAAARHALDAFLSARRPEPAPNASELWLRINAVGSEWFQEDLELLKAHRSVITGVMLPKSESVHDIEALRPASVPVIALVESARGVLNLAQLSTHPHVVRLAFGSADLSHDLGCEDAWDVLLPHRSRLVLHAAASGLPAPIDGVSFVLDQPDSVASDAQQALRLGFGAKLCIHPKQVLPCRRGFAPSAAQQQWAQSVLDAVSQHGGGAQRLAGQMIDRPVIERARWVLRRAQQWPVAAVD